MRGKGVIDFATNNLTNVLPELHPPSYPIKSEHIPNGSFNNTKFSNFQVVARVKKQKFP